MLLGGAHVRRRAMDAIDTEHAVHPERAGSDLAQLRAYLLFEDAELENAVIVDLSQREFVSAHGAIKRRTHQPSLPAGLSEAGSKDARAAFPRDPRSSVAQGIDRGFGRASGVSILSETGEVVEVNEDVLLSAEAFAQSEVAHRASTPGRRSGDRSELRQMLATTRRIIVPLLERCDREGLTSRQGDRRALRGPRLDQSGSVKKNNLALPAPAFAAFLRL